MHISESLLRATNRFSFICESFLANLPKSECSTHERLLSGEKRYIIRICIEVTLFGICDALSDAYSIMLFSTTLEIYVAKGILFVMFTGFVFFVVTEMVTT